VVAERATYGPGREWAHDSWGKRTGRYLCLAEGSTAGGMETGCWYRTRDVSVSVDLTLQTGEGALVRLRYRM